MKYLDYMIKLKNNKLYEKYKMLGDKQDKVIFGGRLGFYQYFDMDSTIKIT